MFSRFLLLFVFVYLFSCDLLSLPVASFIGRNASSVVAHDVNFGLFQQSNLVIAKKISYTDPACVRVSECVYVS